MIWFLLFLHLALAQHYDPWEHGGGGNYGGSSGGSHYMKLRNSGPSKIFEWIGSRFSKLPSLLPRFPTFPKYETYPTHKLPNYHIMMPDPAQSYHGDDDESYSGPPQSDHGDSEHVTYEDNESHQGFKDGPPPSQSQGNYVEDPPPQSYAENTHPSPQSYAENTHPSPQSYAENTHPAPQSYAENTHPSPQSYAENTHPSPQSFPQNTQPSPQTYPQNNHPSPQSYPQNNHPSPQTYPQNTQPSPQSYPQNKHPSPQSHAENTHPPSQPPPQYNEIPQPQPPKKQKESPIEVFPSKMVMYEKEVYPPGGDTAGWQNHPAVRNSGAGPQVFAGSHQSFAARPQDSYASAQQTFAGQPPNSYNQPPPQYKGQGSTLPVKKVPYTPQSTGPDYFNTAYYNQENKFQTDQNSAIGPNSPSYPSFGAAYTAAAQNVQTHKDIDLRSLLSSVVGQSTNPYAHLDYQAQPTGAIPIYKAAPVGGPSVGGTQYVPLSPGVKVLQSQDSGNPAFEIIADANAPTFNGHPFDLNKLISMIEPGAQLLDAPRASEDSSPAGSGPTPMMVSPGSPSRPGDETGTSDFYYFDSPTTNTPLKSLVDLDLPRSPDLDSNTTSGNLKDLMTFFQQTNGKGFVVVEKKGGPHDPGLDSNNDLDTDLDDPNKLNITANTFQYLFDNRGQTFLTQTIPPSIPPSSVQFPHDDLDISDSNNVHSIAITVSPTIKNYSNILPPNSISTFKPLQVIVSQSVSSSVTSSKLRPAPVYKKKIKTTPKP